MSNQRRDHPDLALGPNPLLEALAPFLPVKDLPAALRREPLANVDWRSLPPEQRESLLGLSDDHYWPISPHVHVAAEIQLMLRSGLMQRNPMSLEEQRRINMLALADSVNGVQLQSLRKRAGGSILAAITGLGKSTLVERVLSVLAPQQVVYHGEKRDCGWSVLEQVTYLIVNAPSNATRRGLFAAIIGALDALLGTNYAADLKRQKNLDEAMVFVAKVLSFHRVGMLAIDENQPNTLAENVWGDEFVQYFLGLMNLGIPVLLIGNPLAFSELDASAQLLRRFVTHGWHVFTPATPGANSWWSNQFLPGAIRFTLCEGVPSIDEIHEATSGVDGGLQGIFMAIWKDGQKSALRRAGEAARLTVEDLKAAALSPNVAKLLEIARAVSAGNASSRFNDIPHQPEAPNQEGIGCPIATKQGEASEALSRISRQLKQQESRKQKKKEKDMAARKNLSEDDLRRGADAHARFAGEQADQGELDI
ncbi:TniB family NTP-binding protein [Pseudoxanthomonas mexicana]|uniref:TniB family NTP-binding protein n=1 Tax=Pseudoxanthomonas mexicana TaxID=128785 RepID=UPI0022F3C82F|nr:TniB family NTP-binding protein [Pseudoxanthomonas mexicana]WBX95251.1 TniB family NTP-binding protein [Pseudoxanthomonas mexicana]